MSTKSDPIQIRGGVWYAVGVPGGPMQEECCDCGLVHNQEWKFEGGRLHFRYTRNEKATKAARKRRGIKPPQ